MEQRIAALADFFWRADQIGGMVLLTMLVGTGLYLTIRMGLPQIRYFRHAVALALGRYDKDDDPGEVTHFQALSAALSGTVGIGNIAGVATAIYFGGPGAIFWLWVTAFVGMATKLTECTLALRFRNKNEDGTFSGGPMYSITRGMSKKLGFLGWAFAGFAVLASFGIGNMVQANTVAEQVRATSLEQLGFEIPPWTTGLVMAVLLSLVIIGGIRRIAKVASRLVPFMAAVYVLGALIVAVTHFDQIPAAFALIFKSAFSGVAATGGFLGATVAQALRWGVARGTFSNEAGLGSSPIAHAAARTDEPIREGLVAMLEPFIDTLCVCTLTALAILTTGVWQERLDSSRPAAEVRFYEREIATEAQARMEENYLTAVLRVQNGTPQGTAFFFEGRSVIDNVVLRLDGEPFDGALIVRDGRIDEATVSSGHAQARMSPDDLPRLQLHGRTLASGPTLTAAAFGRAFPGGQLLVTLAIVLFAFSTAISWSYYGDRCIGFLFGLKAVLPYRILFAVMHFFGAIFAVRLVWAVADIANALMALPNLISLWALAPLVVYLRRKYFRPESQDDAEPIEPRGQSDRKRQEQRKRPRRHKGKRKR